MLVLKRDVGESTIIDDRIQVKVLGIEERGGKKVVRLGFEAPRDVQIHREEVHKRRAVPPLPLVALVPKAGCK